MLIIGDVHGKVDKYLEIIKCDDPTLQLGDMGFDYSFMTGQNVKNCFFKGNHDNYDQYSPYDLGDYGVHRGIYYVRGAYSIDYFYRTVGVDFWVNEQLSYQEMSDAIQDYSSVKPDIMVTHDCPYRFAYDYFGYNDRTITRLGLNCMYEIHKPKLWIFGHHHKSIDVTINGVRFICLNELETFSV